MDITLVPCPLSPPPDTTTENASRYHRRNAVGCIKSFGFPPTQPPPSTYPAIPFSVPTNPRTPSTPFPPPPRSPSPLLQATTYTQSFLALVKPSPYYCAQGVPRFLHTMMDVPSDPPPPPYVYSPSSYSAYTQCTCSKLLRHNVPCHAVPRSVVANHQAQAPPYHVRGTQYTVHTPVSKHGQSQTKSTKKNKMRSINH